MINYSDKPWLKTYERYGIPKTLDIPKIPVYQWLDEDAKICPNAIACTYLGREVSYKEVKLHSDKLANALIDLGIKKGDRVANALATSPQFVIADHALLKAGAVSVAISPLYRGIDLEYQLKSSGTKIMFCEDTYVETINSVRDETKLEHIIISSREDYSAKESATPKRVPGAHHFRDLIAKYDAKPPRVGIDPTEDLAFLSFTGGTTGVPKGTMLTHYNIVACWWQVLPSTFGNIGKVLLEYLLDSLRGKLSMMIPFPMNHQAGHSLIYFQTMLGANMLMLPDPRDMELAMNLAAEYFPLLQITVPTLYIKQISVAKEKGTKIPPVLGVSSAAPLSMDIARKYEEKSGVALGLQTYGGTESSDVSHVNVASVATLLGGEDVFRALNRLVGFIPPRTLKAIKPILSFILGPVPPKMLGKLIATVLKTLTSSTKRLGIREIDVVKSVGIPMIATDAKILDPTTGEEVPIGEPGVVYVKGPQVTVGYWPERGKGLKDGWIGMGDILKMDEDDFFYMVDRVKDMINVSGYKVYSTWIDDVLYKHPGVEMAGTIGVPDPERPGSERVKAFIQLKPSYKGKVTEDDIIKICRENLPPYAIPKFVEFRDEFPTTVAQKIFKRKLREEEIKKMRGGE